MTSDPHHIRRERENAAIRSRGLMPIDDARQLLENQVHDFFNKMQRESAEEMSPADWLNVFRSWLSEDRFVRDYKRDMEWLKECGT